MRHIAIVSILMALMVAAQISLLSNATDAASQSANALKEPPIQSGVYGYSGGQVPDGDPEGVVGECIWIYDEHNHQQVAKGDCSEKAPGSFRVVLKPGRYVVRGPGGNTPIEIKPGKWVRVRSIVALPLAP
jgi:hypothetical protein